MIVKKKEENTIPKLLNRIKRVKSGEDLSFNLFFVFFYKILFIYKFW